MKKYLWLLLLLPACANELGVCDVEQARRVVYDEDGFPAFEGQAMMVGSCGWGAFCHSEAIPRENRHGAPFGLDYDVALAAFGTSFEAEETARLRSMQRRAFDHRYEIWGEVSSGRMPIVLPEVVEGAPTFHRLDLRTGVASAAPTLATAEGRETFRNWLACDLPVVERTQTASDTDQQPSDVGYVVPSQEVEPLRPEWSDIYERMIVRRCSSSDCHGSGAAGSLGLDGGSDAALDALLTGEAGGVLACGDEVPGAPLLIPGDPEGSLFFQKLRGVDASGNPVCGDPMPIGGRLSDTSLAAVELWITELR